MKILVTGTGSSGSFAIRGDQLGRAIGAKVVPNASKSEVLAADLVVLVKRPLQDVVDLAQYHRKPIVLDLVDGYPQPQGNEWERDDCLRWLSATLKRVKPVLAIGATQAMAEDVRTLGYKAIHLYHHGRPGIIRNPIRENLRIIGYEGASHYINRWSAQISHFCARHGMSLRITDGKTDRLHEFDVVLGLRDYVGYAAKNYKSNVKLANAQASGTPFIGGFEKGYTETASGAEYFVSDYASFCTAIEWLKDQSARKSASEKMLASAITLESVARDYRRALCAVSF